MSPYALAVQRIQDHPAAPGSKALAQIILSLAKPTCNLNLRRCLQHADPETASLAVNMMARYATHGEEHPLLLAADDVFGLFPDLDGTPMGRRQVMPERRMGGERRKVIH
ncbi:MAG: hypothetical protein ACXU8N_13855 [Telluria sp.]|jgi:hypothetical protein